MKLIARQPKKEQQKAEEKPIQDYCSNCKCYRYFHVSFTSRGVVEVCDVCGKVKCG